MLGRCWRSRLASQSFAPKQDGCFDELQKKANVVNVFNDPEKKKDNPGVAAFINGLPVSLRELAEMCIDRHGEEVLEGTISRRLIEQECKRKNVTVTGRRDRCRDRERGGNDAGASSRRESRRAAVAGLGDRAARGGLWTSTGETLFWPSIALRKLVGNSVQITEADIQKGFEANFGERVRCLAIVLDSHRRATEVWGLARNNPTREYFV